MLNFNSSSGSYYFRSHIPVALSPDGTQLAILGYNCLFVADLLHPVSFYDAQDPAGMSADVAADADACWGSDGRIYFIDDRARLFAVSPQGVLTQLQRTDAPADAAHRYASPVVSPDGTRLAYLCDGKVRIRQLASGQEAEMEQDEWTTSVKILRWMKEDALLMQTRTEVTRETAPFQDTWYTLRINQTKKTYNGMIVTEMIVLGNIAPHLSPDGPYLLFTKDGSLTAMIMYGNIVPDFSPDGTTLVFTEDGSLYLKELAK